MERYSNCIRIYISFLLGRSAETKRELDQWIAAFKRIYGVKFQVSMIEKEKESIPEEWNQNQEEALRDYAKCTYSKNELSSMINDKRIDCQAKFE